MASSAKSLATSTAVSPRPRLLSALSRQKVFSLVSRRIHSRSKRTMGPRMGHAGSSEVQSTQAW